MIASYFKIALRNLQKNKVFSLINILGLAIGLACFVLISTFIKNELNYDTFHKNADRIYRPYGAHDRPGLGVQHNATTPGPLAPALSTDFSQIESAVRIRRMRTLLCQMDEKRFYEKGLIMADRTIFDIFTIPLLKGDPATALNSPYAIVIDQTTARKYFEGVDPIGKTLTLDHHNGVHDYHVTGLMADYPDNSHLSFSMLGSFTSIEDKDTWLQRWQTNGVATYVLLREGVEAAALEAQFSAFLKSHDNTGWGDSSHLFLQSLSDIHLHSRFLTYQVFNKNQGSIHLVYMFSIIAALILLIACINFMNLSTARSMKRAREVGVRKVVGSSRYQLIYQFLFESIIISFLALLLSVVIIELSYPFFKSILEDRIIIDYNASWTFSIELAAIAVVVGIISGSYPAFFLSAYRPIQTLKGNYMSNSRGARLRKGLVLTQFSIAITLIICTGLIQNQMEYIRKKDLGFNRDQIVYVPLRSGEMREKLPVLKEDLRKNSNIVSVTGSAGLRGAAGINGVINVAGTNQEVQLMMRFSFVDWDFLNTMQMEVVQGRNFSREIASDTINSVIINEAAAEKLGWDNAIGKEFEAFGGAPNYKVVGVVKDFHFFSLHTSIEPLIMWVNPPRLRYMLAKVNPGDIQGTISFIEETWREHLPGQPFDYGFLDESFENLHRSDANTGRLFAAFSFIAIFIACLGLFGLASFTAEQKTKEIGIRKVLGASVAGIILLLSRDFTKWVIFACIAAFPAAYWIGKSWLENFAYRQEMQPGIFFGAALIVIGVALSSVIYQAVKAAIASPMDSLRHE